MTGFFLFSYFLCISNFIFLKIKILFMKKVLLSFVLICLSTIMFGIDNPNANPQAIVTSGKMRFTVLTPEMIRIEWSDKALFEDRASFVVINRDLPVPDFTTEEIDGYLYIRTAQLTLQYKIGAHPVDNLLITFQMDGETVTWYPGKPDPYNLKGTLRTLDTADGESRRGELENGLISRSGWAIIDEKQVRGDGSLSLMFDGSPGVDWVAQRQDKESLDWYFLGYKHDYKKALNDFTKIAGKMPMPPLYVFGYWYSKYQRYTEQDFRDIVAEIKANDIPLDVLVIDMDWHLDGWTGWTWNTELFPDPANFISWLHSQNLKTTLNLHPADGIAPYEDNFPKLAKDLGLPNKTIEWNLENKPFYQAFFNDILRPHENIGVDFWWTDWQQWLIAKNEPDLSNTFWINHVFFSDKKLQQKGRPFIFHRWGGLGNHRYPIGFSGDTFSTFPSLAFQPYFTATASNVGYGYWSHDIGGHIQEGDNNPELYLRWIQYAVFSPVLRTHSTNFPNIERRIWKYPNFPLMKEALDLRYALVPYIYTYARYAYDTGISICRPMYYDYPEKDEAYQYEGQYMFGNDILVAPVTEAADPETGLSVKTIWLPEGKWMEAATGTMLDGNQIVTRTFTQEQIPYYYKEGAIIPLYPKLSHLKTRPDKLILQFVPGASGEFSFYEDENDTGNYPTQYTTTKITQAMQGAVCVYTIYPREGSFNGMQQSRSYNIELPAKSRPSEIKVNGNTYSQASSGADGTWSYDEKTSKTIIYIPPVACTSTVTITVA
jgi:hypothetical protein